MTTPCQGQSAARSDSLAAQCSPYFDATSVLARLQEDAAGLLRSLQIAPALESTNTELLRRPDELMHGVALVAAEQWRGRGRGGNSWHSPQGVGIYFSCGWVSKVPLAPTLAHAMAAEVVAMLQRLGLASARLREPNDIYAGDAKLGGVLIEGHSNGSSSRNAVGIGINTEPHPGRDTLQRAVTDLRTEGMAVDQNLVLAELINVTLPFLMRHLPEAP